eukprot:987056-Pelagomonas_calceolata.AAC.1
MSSVARVLAHADQVPHPGHETDARGAEYAEEHAMPLGLPRCPHPARIECGTEVCNQGMGLGGNSKGFGCGVGARDFECQDQLRATRTGSLPCELVSKALQRPSHPAHNEHSCACVLAHLVWLCACAQLQPAWIGRLCAYVCVSVIKQHSKQCRLDTWLGRLFPFVYAIFVAFSLPKS